MTTPEANSEYTAVTFRNVSKAYKLYETPHERMLDQIGWYDLAFWQKRPKHTDFHALRNVDLTIGRGENIGIVGRNGAGKSTLLKLITGNFEPTHGHVEVNGTVQALMQLGIGFHQEFSGLENIKAALHYNGLVGKAFDEALEDVIDFVELGEFLHQPIKTYSLGMNARLQFAAATAIRPDILIIDEVLSAGDGYFAAKSAHRMERLTASGCTLLLVSHSIPQIVQFCDRCVFIHQGEVVMDGPSLEVVKIYEEYLALLTNREAKAREAAEMSGPSHKQSDHPTPAFQREMLARLLAEHAEGVTSTSAKQRISRWQGATGLKISRVEVLDGEGRAGGTVEAGKPCSIEVEVIAEEADTFTCRLAILVMTLQEGFGVMRLLSDQYSLDLQKGQTRVIRLVFDRLLLAKGEFVFSAALFKRYDPNDPTDAIRYDLLSRSFSLRVVPTLRSEPAVFNHPCRWELAAPTANPAKIIA